MEFYNEKQKSITTFILYSFLTLMNVFYIRKIHKLKEKKYHVFMISVLQFCYTSGICAKVVVLSQIKFKTNKLTIDNAKLLIIYFILTALFQTSNMIAHSLFATKYWLLSRKISSILKKTSDKSVYWQVIIIFTTILVIIFLSISLFSLVEYREFKYGKSEDKSPLEVTSYVLYCLPPYIVVIVTVNAFYRLHTCEGSQYSL